METFSALLAFCAGNSSVTGEFPTKRPVTRSFDVFFDLRLNRQLSKQQRRWWFETLPRSLWRHCNGIRPNTDINGLGHNCSKSVANALELLQSYMYTKPSIEFNRVPAVSHILMYFVWIINAYRETKRWHCIMKQQHDTYTSLVQSQ